MNARKFRLRSILLGMSATLVLTGLGMTATAGVAAACGSDGSNSTAFADTLPQVHYRQSGTTVLGLQINLKNRGYPLTGTGYFGPLTLAAVKDFQRKHGINRSGIVGHQTWQALVGRFNHDATNGGRLPDFGVLPGQGDVAGGQERVGWVSNTISRIYGFDRDASSVYDNRLLQKVQRFQRANGIKASGIIGPKTWRAMYQVVDIAGGWGC